MQVYLKKQEGLVMKGQLVECMPSIHSFEFGFPAVHNVLMIPAIRIGRQENTV